MVGPVLTNQFLSMRTGEGGWRESADFSCEGRYVKVEMTYPHQNHIMHEFQAYVDGVGWLSPVAVHSVCGEFTGTPPDYLDVRTAVKSIDGDLASWWQCNENHVGWIIFDLGVPQKVTKVQVYQGQYMDSCDVYVGNNPAEFIKGGVPLGIIVLLGVFGLLIVGGLAYHFYKKRG